MIACVRLPLFLILVLKNASVVHTNIFVLENSGCSLNFIGQLENTITGILAI